MADLLERLSSALRDRYAIEREIGRGGMAVVFLAEDLKHHRQVALKVLHSELTATLGADRFLKEIEIIAGLQHPHILPLYDSGDADGLLYYVMPYVGGESLRQRLVREKQLAVDESVRIAVEVADGLDYAHRKGVVHRDIKPGNILLSEHHAVIADFGIARAIEAARADRVTSTGLGVGTPLYASPEQATAQETLDGRTDIYSLGCVLYEMLSGEPPLAGATPQIIQARRVSETPSPLHDVRDTVPPALDHVIARALARIPADRYATASQFGQALQAAIFAVTPVAQAYPTPAGEPIPQRSPSPRFGRRVALPMVLATIVVLAAALWLSVPWPGGGPLTIATSDITQVTNAAGLEFQPAISPDGREVAYVEGPIGNPRIVVRSTIQLGTGGEFRPGEQDDAHQWNPAWTPDGASIRYYSFASGPGWKWKEVAKLGGSVRTISRPWPGWNRLSPDGSRVVFARGDSIFAYTPDHGLPELLGVHAAGPNQQHSFAWSPDGRRIAYVDGNARWVSSANVANSSIWVLDADGGEPVQVTDAEHLNQSPQWLPDGRHLLFVSDRDGPRGIYVVEVASDGSRGPPQSVPGASDPHSISVSADGRKLSFAKFTARQNIWSVPIPEAGVVSIKDAVPVTSGNQVVESHSLSPDGQWIAFDSDIRGEFDIYRMALTGGVPQLVADIAGIEYGPEWSPDGREIAFQGLARADSSYQIFVISTDGGAPEQLTRLAGHSEYADWSPDGLAIAFHSLEPPGFTTYGTWIVSRDDIGGQWSEPVQLVSPPCNVPDWAPDGASLVCDAGPEFVRVSRTGDVLARIDMSGRLLSPSFPTFSPDGSRIYLRGTEEDGSQGLWWVSSEGGDRTKVVAFDDPARTVLATAFSLGSGRFYITVSEYESDIWVMDLEW